MGLRCSVPSAETSIFYIALAGIIIVPFNEITVISEKMLDGMGKSYISFILIIGIIIYEIAIVNFLAPIFTSGGMRIAWNPDWGDYLRMHFPYPVEIYA